MTLYAYIMTHDTGGAPNPSHGVCTLADCMAMTRGVARKHDYVVGLAGKDFGESRWHIIYAMQVSERLSTNEYRSRFPTRTWDYGGALVSKDFVYWGNRAKPIPSSLNFLVEAFYNSNGRLCPVGHKNKFSPAQVQTFVGWFNQQQKGKQGEPFGRAGDEDASLCPPRRRPRKKC